MAFEVLTIIGDCIVGAAESGPAQVTAAKRFVQSSLVPEVLRAPASAEISSTSNAWSAFQAVAAKVAACKPAAAAQLAYIELLDALLQPLVELQASGMADGLAGISTAAHQLVLKQAELHAKIGNHDLALELYSLLTAAADDQNADSDPDASVLQGMLGCKLQQQPHDVHANVALAQRCIEAGAHVCDVQRQLLGCLERHQVAAKVSFDCMVICNERCPKPVSVLRMM